MDYKERLRRLAINDTRLAGDVVGEARGEPADLDPRTLALVRLAALVAVGGAVPSYGALADAAVSAGATAANRFVVVYALFIAVAPSIKPRNKLPQSPM